MTRRRHSTHDSISIATFLACFPDEAACLAYVFHARHGLWPACPRCGERARFRPVPRRRRGLESACCSAYLSATQGTILEHARRVKLRPWFYALLLYLEMSPGMSINPLRRLLGHAKSTAGELADTLRMHMALSLDDAPLGGVGAKVVVDECQFWLGREQSKVLLLGLSDRRRCVIRVIPDRTARTLLAVISDTVAPGSVIVSDGWPAYRGVTRLGYGHSRVNHARKKWVNDEGQSTAEIEVLWRNTKRVLKGRSSLIGRANLWKFVGEIAYRHNARFDRARAWWQLVSAFRPLDEKMLAEAQRRFDPWLSNEKARAGSAKRSTAAGPPSPGDGLGDSSRPRV